MPPQSVPFFPAMGLAAKLSLVLLGLFALPVETPAQEQAGATVVIAGKKAAVVKKIDKTVHDVSKMARAANGSAQDVLQATPDVFVTADGRISVKGNAQVTVLVDGKPNAMLSGDERVVALQTMSGADIASVEVITNPSAAFSANGGAILNIVLKHNRKPGSRAQLQGSASDQGLWNVGASGDINRKQLRLRGNVAFRRDGTLKFRESAADWTNPVSGQSGQTLQSSEVFIRRTVKSAGLGIDHDLSSNDSMSLSARYNSRGSRPLFDVLNVERSTVGETIYHRVSYGPNEQSDASASLSYSHQGNGSALKAAVQRSATTGLIDKSYRDVFVHPASVTRYSHGATDTSRHLTQGTLDWSKAAKHGQWGLGLDVQVKVDDMYNYQASVDSQTDAEFPDPETTNGYSVKSTLNALYLTNQIRRGQWEVLLGGRVEYLALEVNPALGVSQRGHRLAFNPSLHLRYDFSGQTDLALSYRRSLQRPDPRDLNPFTTYVDAHNLSRGNPGLKPQLLTSWEIGSNTEVGRVSGTGSVFYRTSRDTVVDARSFAGHVLITSKQNGGRARSAGIAGALDWKNAGKTSWGIDGGVYRVLLQTPDLSGITRQAGTSAYLNFRAAYAGDDGDIALDAHVQSKSITPLGELGGTSSLNVTWRRRLSKTLSLTVNATDLLNGSKRTYQTNTSTFRQTGFDHFVARRIYIGFVKKIE